MRSTAARSALSAAVAIVLVVSIVAFASPPATAQESGGGTTTFAIDLQPDGDARVTVTLRVELESDAEVEAFEQLREEHVTGASPQIPTRPFERSAAEASASTGRAMSLHSLSRSAGRDNRTGRYVLAFTWTNFSQVSDDRLVLGDVFHDSDGTWLSRLEPNQELVISFPDGYRVQSVSRPLQNGTIHVEGPATFGPGQPSAVLVGSPQGPVSGLLLVGGGAGLLVVLAIALYLYRYRGRAPDATGEVAAGGGAGDGAAPAQGAAEEPAPADDPLLSDEERVLRLLEREGGRMKQVDIVEATDWSNAKVSQLLSEMDEAGRVDKLRIGRENLISLPGEGPGGK